MRVSPSRTAQSSSAERSLSVLVAGDAAGEQKNAITEVVQRAGHRATTTYDDETLLEALDTGGHDLVFVHVSRHALACLDTIKFYRFLSLDRPHVPIVAVVADVTTMRHCRAAGVDACVSMPSEWQRLLEILPKLANKYAASITRDTAVRPNDNAVGAAVDLRTLAALEELGGAPFANEIVAQFLDDSPEVLGTLTTAVEAGNDLLFDERLHELRNAAANIGARGLYEMCSRPATPDDFVRLDGTPLEKLHAEFRDVRRALHAWLGQRLAAAPSERSAVR